jgi:glycosyltransferase involved in cell wall biosynthesis
MAQPWFARLPRNKTVEVPNGVDLDLFRPSADRRRVRQKLGIGADTSLVLFVAALDRAHHFKGLTRLLEALRERPDPAIHLLVVGDGDQRGVYEAQAEAWELRPKVHFVGAIPQSELPPYLAAADLLALPTSPPESFGMVLIEAMACGTPVIASDIPGVRDVVRRTGGGLLVPPHDARALATALVEGLRDRQHLVELGAAGRRAVEAAFHWQRIGLQLDSLYRDVLGTEPARPPAQTTGVATQ